MDKFTILIIIFIIFIIISVIVLFSTLMGTEIICIKGNDNCGVSCGNNECIMKSGDQIYLKNLNGFLSNSKVRSGINNDEKNYISTYRLPDSRIKWIINDLKKNEYIKNGSIIELVNDDGIISYMDPLTNGGDDIESIPFVTKETNDEYIQSFILYKLDTTNFTINIITNDDIKFGDTIILLDINFDFTNYPLNDGIINLWDNTNTFISISGNYMLGSGRGGYGTNTTVRDEPRNIYGTTLITGSGHPIYSNSYKVIKHNNDYIL